MYRHIALLSLLATAVVAEIPGLPTCAQTCITNYGGCNQVDVACICSNTALLETLSCCVSKKCDAAGVASVVTFAHALCGSYGVTTLPTAATCASTATATATATASVTSTATVSTTSAATTATGSSASSHSSALTSASSAASSAASYGPSATGSATSSAASSASAATTAGSYANKVEGGLLGLVVAGLVAAL